MAGCCVFELVYVIYMPRVMGSSWKRRGREENAGDGRERGKGSAQLDDQQCI